jgi:phosphatidylserine/phosphatidylglycerophosphate/cardiolipin synthase-like enzyme
MRAHCFFILLVLCLPCQALSADLILHDAPVEVYFSPHGGATESLVRRIDAARRDIAVLAYSFTSRPVVEALCRAVARGVHVEAVLDRSQRAARGGQGQTLASCGGTVYIDARHAIAHNKIMVFDGRTVSTGSFNFTAAAENSNAENLVIIDSPDLARLYSEDWERHRAHAEPW